MSAITIESDDVLIELLREGSLAAFNEIYTRHFESLYKFAYTILKDEAACEDILQNVFTWLWENRANLKITSLKAYLFAAVKFNMSGAIRLSKRRSEILANAPMLKQSVDVDSMELKELIAIISSFTETLPERARLIFELSRKEYLTNREIALKLGISEKTVENQMNISLKKLKIHLGRMSFWCALM
ncbi:MAG: RNA polymerase sigma-70 factor [Pedobacter sp.]|uniref:RNA polymerase sigma-70 factor n=1 Tax=Pedobacter sp. TaxID=1411316 RepID=UPI00339736A8